MQSTKIRESLCSASDRNMCSNPQDSTRAFDQHLSREPTGSRRRVSCSEIRNRDERTESRLQQEVPKRPKPIHHCLLTATVRLAANGKNFIRDTRETTHEDWQEVGSFIDCECTFFRAAQTPSPAGVDGWTQSTEVTKRIGNFAHFPVIRKGLSQAGKGLGRRGIRIGIPINVSSSSQLAGLSRISYPSAPCYARAI